MQLSQAASFRISVVVLAEDRSIQEKLAYYDLKVQTIAELSPIQVYPARVLSHLFSHLGEGEFAVLLDLCDTDFFLYNLCVNINMNWKVIINP